MLTEDEITGGAAGEERVKQLADELEAVIRASVSKERAETAMSYGDVLTGVSQKLAFSNPCLALLMRAYSVAAASIAANGLTPFALAELGRKDPEDVESLRVSAVLLRRSADLLDQFLSSKH